MIIATIEWSTVSGVLATIIGALAIWSAFREIYIRQQEKRASAALNEMIIGYSKVTAIADVIVSRLTDMTQMSKESRKEQLDFIKERANEQRDLVLKIEDRLREAIQEVSHRHGTPLVQFSNGQGAANQAGDNHSEQR